ncbi:MAG: N-6 DNA methylase [Nitrososphaerota archaeon]
MAEIRAVDVDDVLTSIRNAVRLATNEEEVRLRVSTYIEEKILKPLNITQVGKYEYTLISGARIDALYGHVVIEYKAPGKLSTKSDTVKAKQQLINYISSIAEVKDRYKYFIGVIISDKIAFLKYDVKNDEWILRGPYDITRETVIKLIEIIRGLQRKPLTVENLVRDFGPESPTARKIVRIFYEKVAKHKTARVNVLFNEWLRVFSQATGYAPEKLKELQEIVKEYGLAGKIDYNALLFSLHTYYALIMKLLAAEIAYLYGGGKWLRSYIAELENAYMEGGVEGLKQVLKELEDGGIFTKLLNIVNFVEGDYFSWYLDVLDTELGDAIAEVARRLSDYEPATPHLEPETTRDLLKRLYQALIPRDVRHKLGEFYTPDWLAELILNEVGLTLEKFEEMGSDDPLRPLELRVLDPACGSGTFLILYLKRLRQYAEEHYLTDQLVNYVLYNVIGYDLNPLAVLAARTNYLLAIGDLLSYAKGRVEIPVYLADSILVESRSDLRGEIYLLRASVGNFEMPKTIVEDARLLQEILAEIDRALKSGYTEREFTDYIRSRYGLGENEVYSISRLYEAFLKLEKDGKNHVWISIIRNAFAPIVKGRFDFIIGNPPWIAWENLPESYREISAELWKRYGIVSAGTARFKRDMAMLFFARCFDLYLKEGGIHGFLIPFTVLKTQAGAGFRKFLASKSEIMVIHDLVTLYPFEGAVNRTSAIVVKKPARGEVGKSSQYEFKHVIWLNNSRRPIPTEASLEEVLRITERCDALMVPIIANDPRSPWMQVTPKALTAIRKVLGKSTYQAHEGVHPAFNQIYFVRILEKNKDGTLIITNPPESGQKKIVKQVTANIEPEVLYPLIRGRDVKKWYVKFSDRYVIVPHKSSDGTPFPLDVLKKQYPATYAYLHQFREELIQRAIKPFLSIQKQIRELTTKFRTKSKEIDRLKAMLHEKFHILDNIGAYTFSPYKVVWKRIAGAITGKATSFACAVVEPHGDKPVVPDDSTILVSVDDEEEAYYLSGILNSILIRATIAAYTYELRQETHILENIRISPFDSNNIIHKRIAALSKKAHQLSKYIHEKRYDKSMNPLEELKLVEDELDKVVAQLYGITDEELGEIRKLYAILAGEEFVEEHEAELEKPIEPVIRFTKTMLISDTEDVITLSIVNPRPSKLRIILHLPTNDIRTIEVDEGEHVIEIPIKLQQEGTYNLLYEVSINGKIVERDKIELMVTRPKRFRT